MAVRTQEAPQVPQETKTATCPAERPTLAEAKNHLIAQAQLMADRLAQTAESAEYDMD